ncbi:hypothetical protein RJ639_046996 [Escallonia herrerae]|uniref:Methyltransferase n=1 Tax=Escallonia herrerae TaxID=1293975 RepID=A0AA88W866_9ASTE|nr:hypothetical protein RJ639_046996 [Escallonia herrerae]
MAPPTPPPPQNQLPPINPLRKPFIKVLLLTILCSLSYILGSYKTQNFSSPISSSTTLLRDPNCLQTKNLSTHQNYSPQTLHYEPQHTLSLPLHPPKPHKFSICPRNFTHYCPCQDPHRESQYSVERLLHRERHCPNDAEKLRCLVPKPQGYRRPVPWPKSRDYAWFNNVPFKRLTVSKKDQNWVRLEGDRLFFPGGGTSFPMGIKGYIDRLKKMVPLKSGTIRTVLDVGCGVASFGASLMDYKILTMSIAPRDIHEAQVQFALERGVPAMLGVLSMHRLPYPSRSFDMAHCSRCLVQWTAYDGLNLLEIDRVLRPGGYWVLSGPPIGWRVSYKGWERSAQDLESEQNNLEDLARLLCWKKVREKGLFAVWQKPTNHVHCSQKLKALKSPKFCNDADPDAAWYRKMDACITPLPKVVDIHDVSGGALEKWPKRLKSAPPRLNTATSEGTTTWTFDKDNIQWKRRVLYYDSVLKLFGGRYRNVMDMNAGLGGFAAALSEYPVWVMNVVPVDAKFNTLGIVYERGLIGTYMNWCEAFSTYPRTYDLIHAHGLFSLYIAKCNILDILLEMHRIVRPEGAIIIRDHVDIIVKVKDLIERLRWNSKLSHSETGPFHPEKILFVEL